MTSSTSHNDIILITGGTGFAGSHLVDLLLEMGHKNIHVTSYGTGTGHVGKLLPSSHIHSLNLTDFEKTKQLLASIRPTQIYQLAALAGVGSSFSQIEQVIAINTKIQLSILTAATDICPKARILSIGTALEYQPKETALKETDQLGPVNPYGVSKVTQEMLAYSYHKQHNLDIVFSRSFNHFGERQAPGFVIADFSKQITQLSKSNNGSKEILVGNLEAHRDLTYVKDIARAYVLLMNQGEKGEVYNVGSGVTYSVKEILQKLINLRGQEIKIVVDQQRFRPIDVPIVLADNSKLSQLGWQPKVDINSALEQTLNYYQNN